MWHKQAAFSLCVSVHGPQLIVGGHVSDGVKCHSHIILYNTVNYMQDLGTSKPLNMPWNMYIVNICTLTRTPTPTHTYTHMHTKKQTHDCRYGILISSFLLQNKFYQLRIGESSILNPRLLLDNNKTCILQYILG